MTPAIKELDEFIFHPVIADTKGVSVVFFSGPDCSSCHYLRDLFNTELQQFKNSFPLFKVFEIKADKATALVNEFNVFHLPSMFLYRDGQFHSELHAPASARKIINAIKLALSLPAEEEP